MASFKIIAPLLACLIPLSAFAVDVNIIQHNYPAPSGARYPYPGGYGNVVTPYPEPRVTLPYTGPVPARDRMEVMREYMERTEQQMKAEAQGDTPLTRADFEEILDRKLDEKLAKNKPEAPEKEPPSPFGPVGGLGQVGGVGTVGGTAQ